MAGLRGTYFKKIRYYLLIAVAALAIIACSTNSAVDQNAVNQNAAEQTATVSTAQSETQPSKIPSEDDPLIILWDKGYVTEEDEAIEKVVADWTAKTGIPIDLSFYNSAEIAPKTLRSTKAGRSPDVLFAAKSVYPVSDWEGQLADVTDVVAPLAASYNETAKQSAKVFGSESASDGQERYYAVPLNQSTTHIYYWKDFLSEAGYTPEDIPTDWDAFWAFWQTVQDQLEATNPAVRSIGLPYSVDASDTYHIFEHVLAAYDVKVIDERGNLLLDVPAVKEGIVECLNWYAQFYQDGYVPENAVDWLDTENNRAFLDRNVVMTPNPTLSIPAAVRNDQTLYSEKLGTVEFPNKLNGEPLPHFVSIRQAVVFTDAPHLDTAKDFLTYLTEPAVLSDFLKTSYGRYMPPAKSQIQADSFWQDPADPHVFTVVKTVLDEQVQPFQNVYNPAYGIVMERNVWGNAIDQMVSNGMSAEDATEEAIAQIKDIFADRL